MNSDTSRPHDQPVGDHQPPAADLQLVNQTGTGDVPVFSCIVYVSQREDRGVQVRVANLSGLIVVADTERDALAKVVPAFKQRIAEHLQSGAPIPWIDPPSPAEPHEQQRFIPVHL